ncbi:hypothetical protein ccbrp13_65470 [Ktedonobacteria bacterium brp13]|nr:hypothetical protein ccbrp13_65470 [Ktedonobacteria bacterium brp13]
MYNFSLETLLYFAKIRQLKGTFHSSAFYGFGDFYDPCVVTITVQSGSLLSCIIYDRYSQIIENTEPVMNVLRRTVVEWTFKNTTNGHESSFTAPSTSSLPELDQLSSFDIAQTVKAQPQRTPPPLNTMRNPRYSDNFQTDTFSYAPAAKSPTGPIMFTAEPHYNIPPMLDRFPNLVPHRLKSVSRSEILQWKGNIKSIYMRTNGINTIAQIATMLSLRVSDVLQILLQLEKDGLISLDNPV